MNNKSDIDRAEMLSGLTLSEAQQNFIKGRDSNSITVYSRRSGATTAQVLSAVLNCIDEPNSQQLFLCLSQKQIQSMIKLIEGLNYNIEPLVSIQSVANNKITFSNDSSIKFKLSNDAGLTGETFEGTVFVDISKNIDANTFDCFNNIGNVLHVCQEAK